MSNKDRKRDSSLPSSLIDKSARKKLICQVKNKGTFAIDYKLFPLNPLIL